MNNWHQFLAQQGGRFDRGIIVSFGETAGDYAALGATTTLTDIGDQGLLSLSGAQSAKFLQGQVTCDVNTLTEGTSIPGAICNLKGRVTTNFRLITTVPTTGETNQILMLMHRELVPPTIATLSKYAVFSKTVLSDCSGDYRQFGVAGPLSATALATLFTQMPQANNQTVGGELATLIRIDAERFIVLVPQANAAAVWGKLAANTTPVGFPFWQLLNVRAGFAHICPETSGEFVPQMLNYQALGAVSFKKGCYTGQEIVARMQYLGKLKRRLYRLSVDAVDVCHPGAVITGVDGTQEVGQVVLAAAADATTQEILAVLTQEAAQQPQLVIADTPVAVTPLPLPYSLDTP